MITLLANIHYDDGLLPYFLKYYSTRGVELFGIVAHCKFDEKIFRGYPVHLESHKEPYINGPRDAEILDSLRTKLVSNYDWFIPTDLDEFHWTPGLIDFRHYCADDYEWIPSVFIDRIAADGSIPVIDPRKSLDSQFPLRGLVIQEINKGAPHKVALCRGYLNPSSGHHNCHPAKFAPFTFETHHFKWQGRDFWKHMSIRQLVEHRMFGETGRFTEHFHKHGRINTFTEFAAPIGI